MGTIWICGAKLVFIFSSAKKISIFFYDCLKEYEKCALSVVMRPLPLHFKKLTALH